MTRLAALWTVTGLLACSLLTTGCCETEKKQLAALQQQYNDLQLTNQDLKKSLAQCQARAADLEAKLAQKDSQLTAAKTELADAKQKLAARTTPGPQPPPGWQKVPGGVKITLSSDILFASEMARTGKEGRFVKSGWRVIPNTTRHYLTGAPLSFYLELYNLQFPSRDDKGFVLGYSLVDTLGNTVKTFPARRFKKPGNSCVKVDSLDTEGLAGDIYALQVEAFDRDSRTHIRTRRRVWLTSPGGEETLTEAQKDQLRYYSDIRYVADERDLKIYKSLRGTAQRNVAEAVPAVGRLVMKHLG